MFILFVKPGNSKRLISTHYVVMLCMHPNRCIDEGSDSLDLLCQCAGTISNLAEDARNQVGWDVQKYRPLVR